MSDVSEDLRRIQRAATAQTAPNLKTAAELNPGEWCRAAGEWFVVERAAARDAAGDALKPTEDELFDAAHVLVDRMLKVTGS